MAFELATRRKTKLRLALEGPAGSGKTLSSLLIAFGITGDWSKVGIADTEHCRALAYVGREEKTWSVGQFRHQPLDPPYTLSRYLDVMKEAERAGLEVLILDSISHAWMGKGGILDYVNEATRASQSKNSFNAWDKGTKAQDTFVEAIMASPMHIIATMRVKTAWDIVEDERGKKKPVKIGQAAVQRASTDYEFDVIFTMTNDGHYAEVGKDTTGLYDGRIFVPGPEIGMQFLAWSEEGADEASIRSARDFAIDDTPAPATNATPAAISADQVAELEGIIGEKGRSVSGVVASLNRHGVCPAGLETIPVTAFDDVATNLRALKPAPAVAAPADNLAAVEAAREAPLAAVEPVPADEPAADPDPETAAFLEGCAADAAAVAEEAPPTSDGAIKPRQLQRLGILCKILEDNGVMWRAIPPMAGKASRKDLTFEEAQALIKTIASIAKAFPEAKEAVA